MTPMEQLKAMVAGKKVAFIGAGVSHKPCITMLAALGADITLCDQKKSLDDFGDYADTLRKLNVKLSLGEHYTDGFAGQDIIMRTPGYEFFKPELQAKEVTSNVLQKLWIPGVMKYIQLQVRNHMRRPDIIYGVSGQDFRKMAHKTNTHRKISS